MTGPKTLPDPDGNYFCTFILAGIGDLRSIADHTHSGWGTCSPVSQAAQLSMFLLLITKGIEPKHKDNFTHKDQLTKKLNAVYTKSKAVWEEGLAAKSQLHDTSVIDPYIFKLSRFAEKNFGRSKKTLSDFGVSNVQVALGTLIKTLAIEVKHQLKLGPDGRGDIPGPVLGGLLVATVAGDVGLQGSVTRDQAMAMRVGVGIGTSKPEPQKPEPKAAKKIRRTLIRLAKHIRALKD